MKKSYRRNVLQVKSILFGILVLLGVSTYQIIRIANSLQQLELKFDLFEVVGKLFN